VIRTESRIAITGSVPDVWAYLCDVARWSEWAPTVREAQVAGGGPLQPGARIEQRAKGPFGTTHHRAQHATVVEKPRRLAFAGPMGTSTARWGMEFEPLDEGRTDATMWIEIDRGGVMRAIPAGLLEGRVRRVMDREMAAIKAAVEAGS
jgi:carbon monoxide dehydrogenase subunit G